MATPMYLRMNLVTDAPPSSPGFPFWGSKTSGRSVTPGAVTKRRLVCYGLSPTIGTGTGSLDNAATVLGPTAGLIIGNENSYVSDPLAAAVTLGGSGVVTFDICGYESNMSANAGWRIAVYRMNKTGELTLFVSSAVGVEMGTSLARQNWTAAPAGLAFAKGDRIVVVPMIDDVGTMAAGYTGNLQFNGAAASTADSKVTFTETLTFSAFGSGTIYHLRDTVSAVSGGRELRTTQGAAVSTAVHTTVVGGATYPGDQWTDTAGGADVAWYTPALDAFTLAGVIKLTAPTMTLQNPTASPFDEIVFEVAVCDADGTNPVVFGASVSWNDTVAIAGPDLAVGQGKRLRLRLYQADGNSDAVAGTNRTFKYGGGAASVTHLTFTQTITEAATGTTYNQALTAGVTSAASLLRENRKALPAQVGSSSVVNRFVTKAPLLASLANSGALTRLTARQLLATLGSTSILVLSRLTNKDFTASVTTIGSLVRQTQLLRTGAAGSVGVLARTLSRLLPASVASGSGLTRQTNRGLTAGVATQGLLAIAINKILTAAVSSASSLSRSTTRLLTSAVSSAGALLKTVPQNLTAAVASASSLSRNTARLLIATVSSAGNLLKETARTLTATVASGGALAKRLQPLFTGTVGASAVLTKALLFTRNFVATVTSSASLTRQAQKTLAASAGIAGELSRLPTYARLITGTVAIESTVTKETQKTFLGVITSESALVASRLTGVLLAAAVTTTATLSRLVSKLVTGAVASEANLNRVTSKNLEGTVAIPGVVNKRLDRLITATVSITGVLPGPMFWLPSGDVSGGTWTSTEPTYAAAINDASDITYITSALSPVDDTVIVSLPNQGVPGPGPLSILVRGNTT